MAVRQAQLERKSKETEIKATLNIDGTGQANIKSPLGLLDHMLELFTFHGYFDINLEVQKSDLEIDIHHTNEDIGIVLGKVFKKALDEKEGIHRYGSAFAPMESTLGHAVVDISGRGYMTFTLNDGSTPSKTLMENLPVSGKEAEGYSLTYLEHFLESFAHMLGATICVEIIRPSDDLHTNIECVFKALGMALDQATQIDPRRQGVVPSTKGIID